MADPTSASPAKIPTPPRPSAAPKPPSVRPAAAAPAVPPAPASRPSPPKAPQAVKVEAPTIAAPVVPAPAPVVVAPVVVAPVVVAPIVVAPPPPPPPPALARVEAVASLPPAPASSPRKSFLSIGTWDAFGPAPDPLALAKLTPAVTMRRARLTKYVKGIVAGCAGLCLIALVRVAVASASETEDPTASATAIHKAHVVKTLDAPSEDRTSRSASFAVKTATARHH